MSGAVNLINGSRDIRDTYISNTEVLDKVKQLSLLPDKEHMTLRQVADYYEIDIEVVRKTIQRHREELNSDGMMKLSGKSLEEYKSQLPYSVPELHKVPSTQLLNRRAILRMGMVLKNSKVAEAVRTYLLEAEKLITSEQKTLIFQGSWTDEIDQFIIDRVNKDDESSIRFNDTLRSLAKEIHATVHQIKNYWYVGGQGKEPLRNRLGLRLISNNTVQNVSENPPYPDQTEYTDLFAFGADQEQMNMNKILLSELKTMQETQQKMVQHINTLQVTVVDHIKKEQILQDDNRELKDMIAELYTVAQQKNEEELHEVEKKYANAMKRVKSQQTEIEELKNDMNDLIRRAGMSVLLGDFNTPEFRMEKNGNLERMK
ncbi:hypothetical protein [Viridibacillus arvi]|uniref:hypothetical protein n=1 Tax=Viridibacillus arvi TaxID=263475 RepID=UPI0034CE8DCE